MNLFVLFFIFFLMGLIMGDIPENEFYGGLEKAQATITEELPINNESRLSRAINWVYVSAVYGVTADVALGYDFYEIFWFLSYIPKQIWVSLTFFILLPYWMMSVPYYIFSKARIIRSD